MRAAWNESSDSTIHGGPRSIWQDVARAFGEPPAGGRTLSPSQGRVIHPRFRMSGDLHALTGSLLCSAGRQFALVAIRVTLVTQSTAGQAGPSVVGHMGNRCLLS